MVTEKILAPPFRKYFEERRLTEDNIATICRAEDTFFDHYAPGETFTLELPTILEGYPNDVKESMAAKYTSGISIDPPFVCELSDVELFGPDAISMKNGGFIFENSLESVQRLTTSGLVSIAHGELPHHRPSRATERLHSAISLVGPWNRNYTHWFQDYLARLEGLEHLCDRIDRKPKLLIPENASQWMREALLAVGYPPEQWVEWPGGRVVVDRFIVASVRREARQRATGRRLLYSPTEFQWLRDRIMDNIEPEQTIPHSPRIFISRGNATVRRVTNEEETMNQLRQWGFERYHLEELGFAEQVTLFSEAEVIISSHGSGLMNQIFAEDATVIEIFGPKHSITDPAIEYYLADLLGHDYGCLQGETIGPDVRVDLERLETLLEVMLNGN